MFKLFKKKQVRNDQVNTLSQNYNQDLNKNQIPDYLERKDLPSVIKSSKDYMMYSIDTTPEIEEYIMQLRGFEKGQDGVSYKSYAPPQMNNIGVSIVKSFLIPTLNKHAINTSTKAEEVDELTYINTKNYARILKYNYHKMGINSTHLGALCSQFESFIWLIMSRGIGDLQRQHDSERLRLSGTVGSQQQPPLLS